MKKSVVAKTNRPTAAAKAMAMGMKYGPQKTLRPVAGKAMAKGAKAAGKMMIKKMPKKR